MSTKQIEWITPDGYQIEDILARRRCIICAHLATGGNIKTRAGTEYYLCDNTDCKEQLVSVIEALNL